MQAVEQLARDFLDRHPDAAAAALEGLTPLDAATAITALELPQAIAVIGRLPVLLATRCLSFLTPAVAAAIMNGLPLREAVELYSRLPAVVRERVAALLPATRVRALRAGLEGLGDTVAGLMDAQVLSLAEQTPVEHALQLLARERDHPGCHLHVTDAAGRLVGVVRLLDLYAAHPGSRLGSLPVRPVARLPAGARVASVLGHSGWLRFTCLPVVDGGGRFLGVLRRERLQERAPVARHAPAGALGMTLSLLEAYSAANMLVFELLLRGGVRDE